MFATMPFDIQFIDFPIRLFEIGEPRLIIFVSVLWSTIFLSNEKYFSTGAHSGEYAGINAMLIFSFSMYFFTEREWWVGALSIRISQFHRSASKSSSIKFLSSFKNSLNSSPFTFPLAAAAKIDPSEIMAVIKDTDFVKQMLFMFHSFPFYSQE